MKSSMTDNAEGKLHKAKGKAKETIGNMVGNRDLEARGRAENLGGKLQEKRGQVKKALGK